MKTAQPLRTPGSVVNAAIDVPLTPIQKAIDAVMPEDIHGFRNTGGGTGNSGGTNTEYFIKPGPVQLTASGNAITATMPLQYFIRFRIGTGFFGATAYYSCGFSGDHQSLRDMDAVIILRINGVTSAWTPDVTWSVASVQPGPKRCHVNFLLQRIDLSGLVANQLEKALSKQLPALTKSLSRALDLHRRAAAAWAGLFRPIPVGPDLWLQINPVGFGISPVSSSRRSLVVGLQVKGYPELIAARQAPNGAAPPALPRPAASARSDLFRVEVPVEMGYNFASSQVNQDLWLATGGMRYPPVGGQHITVTAASLYGYGSTAVLRVEAKVSGIFGRQLVVYLVGTPTLDSMSDVLSFPDLRLTVSSRNLLTRFAAWLDRANMERDLRSRLRFDLSGQVAIETSRLRAGLRQRIGRLALSGDVAQMTLLGVKTDPKHGRFEAVLLATGTLRANILQ